MARWVCPRCDREFGGVNQAHVCAPGITVDELLGRHPDWVGEIYAVVIGHLQGLGPVHEDAVDVGIFLKGDRKIAEFRPLVRSVQLWLFLPDRREDPRITRSFADRRRPDRALDQADRARAGRRTGPGMAGRIVRLQHRLTELLIMPPERTARSSRTPPA